MNLSNNLWKDDKGFIWMLAISIISLVSSQITTGIILESKFIVRVGFFLFTVIAINSSALRFAGKVVGYTIACSLLLLAVVMIWSETQMLLLVYTGLATGYMIFIIALVVNQIFAGGIITVYKVGGGVATYILIGQLWASLYLSVYILHPDAFKYGGELIQARRGIKTTVILQLCDVDNHRIWRCHRREFSCTCARNVRRSAGTIGSGYLHC